TAVGISGGGLEEFRVHYVDHRESTRDEQGRPRIGKALPPQLHRGTAELEILQGALGSFGRRRQCISPINLARTCERAAIALAFSQTYVSREWLGKAGGCCLLFPLTS